jgi:preprotein translocase subunit SecA
MEGLDQKELIVEDYVANILSDLLDEYTPERLHPDQWNIEGLKAKLVEQFGFDMTAEGLDEHDVTRHELGESLFDRLKERYEAKEQIISEPAMRTHERMIMLSVLDGLWKDHLLNMDHLKEGIGLRGYGQKDPLVEYKKESFDMFEEMMGRFQEDTVRYLFLMQIIGPDGKPVSIPSPRRGTIPAAPPVASAAVDGSLATNGHHGPVPLPQRSATPETTIDSIEREFQRKKHRELEHARMAGGGEESRQVAQRRTGDKVGRNDPCPCGSGKKYKKCHGAGAEEN